MPTEMDKITSAMVDPRFPKPWLYWFQRLAKLIGEKLDIITSAAGKVPQINSDGELEASTLVATSVVQGPATSVVGNVATFNNATGTLLSDAGVPLPEPSDTVVEETSYGIASDAGTSDDFSRADHTHGTPSEASVPSAASTVMAETSYGLSSNAGSALTYSKGDHTHGTPLYYLATVTGINAKTVAQTTIYTVPAGKSLVIERVVIRCTAFTVGSKSVQAVASLGGNSATYDDYLNSVTYTIAAVSTTIIDSLRDTAFPVYAEASVIKLSVETGSNATTETWAVDLFGYLI